MIEATYGLNCRVGNFPLKYLGLLIGENPRKLKTWELVVDIIKKRLSRWSLRFLSMGGRLVLLKYVLFAIRIYYFSFFKVPIGIISKTEALYNKSSLRGGSEDFWKIHWVGWEKVCSST